MKHSHTCSGDKNDVMTVTVPPRAFSPLKYSKITTKELDATGKTLRSRFTCQIVRFLSKRCESCSRICSVLRFSIGFNNWIPMT